MTRGERFPVEKCGIVGCSRLSTLLFDRLTRRFADTPKKTLSRPFRRVKTQLVPNGVKLTLQLSLTHRHRQITAGLCENASRRVGRSSKSAGDRVGVVHGD